MRNKSLKDAMAEIEETYPQSPEVTLLLQFIRESKRGIVRYGRGGE